LGTAARTSKRGENAHRSKTPLIFRSLAEENG
jgi:hypothetical protein